MKWVDLKNKNTDELREMLAEQKAKLQNLNFQAHGHQLKQVHKINQVRKTITRLKVLLIQREAEEKNKDTK